MKMKTIVFTYCFGKLVRCGESGIAVALVSRLSENKTSYERMLFTTNFFVTVLLK